LGEGTFEELIGEGRYEGPGIASGVVCTSKFLPHGDIATSQPGKEDLKWFRQNICKPGDQGIILKGPKGPTSLCLQTFKRTLDVAGEWLTREVSLASCTLGMDIFLILI